MKRVMAVTIEETDSGIWVEVDTAAPSRRAALHIADALDEIARDLRHRVADAITTDLEETER